eukprot:9658121-Alexandrium_andersonii.AAC.1
MTAVGSAGALLDQVAKDSKFAWANNSAMLGPLQDAKDKVEAALDEFRREWVAHTDIKELKAKYEEHELNTLLGNFAKDMQPLVDDWLREVKNLQAMHKARKA